uniref:F-box domain-containing protein n=1 Tax=Oryza punctata TaxID=4537 RepID=A0A0E0MPZ8_ORYPU
MDLLPDDLLADVLCRLPPRSLAALRRVCQAWRAIVDDRSLLAAAALLPCTLRGIFVQIGVPTLSGFFARPSPAGRRPAIPGALDLDYLDTHDECLLTIIDHCNGLLLLHHHVVNPATRQWTRLPPYPPPESPASGIMLDGYHALVFDPAVSPHYEVFLMPQILKPAATALLPAAAVSGQWPPSPLLLHVFSSRTEGTWRWEERSFVREGNATMGTIDDVCSSLGWEPWDSYSVYLRGALYMHCQNNCVIKLAITNHKYRIIKLPGDFVGNMNTVDPYLGKSQEGVYYALVIGLRRLQIWYLKEYLSSSSSSSSSNSYGGLEAMDDEYEWELKHDADLGPVLAAGYTLNDGGQQWIWHNIDTRRKNNKESLANEEEFEWYGGDDDSDENASTGEDRQYKGYISQVFGFHPFKPIVFLCDTDTRVVAYHYNRSKVQDLGVIIQVPGDDRLSRSFPYTPCWIQDLPGIHN